MLTTSPDRLFEVSAAMLTSVCPWGPPMLSDLAESKPAEVLGLYLKLSPVSCQIELVSSSDAVLLLITGILRDSSTCLLLEALDTSCLLGSLGVKAGSSGDRG